MQGDWDCDHMSIKCFEKFAFSVSSIRPHENDRVAFSCSNLSIMESVFSELTRPHKARTVAFSSLSTLESVFKSLRFHR